MQANEIYGRLMIRGKTASDLARDLEVSPKFVQLIIHGERKGKKAAIQCSLQALENFAIQYPDGRTETIHVPQMEHTPIGTAIKDEWMVRMGFPTPIIDELFELIVFFSEVQLPLSMPSEPPSGETDKSSQESKD